MKSIVLDETEKKIVDARISEKKCIEDLDKLELKNGLFKTVLGISFISGGELPSTDDLIEMFINELKVFIIDFGYGKYALCEIILAFRINTASVFRDSVGNIIERKKLKTNNLSIEYISDVLVAYRQSRFIVDRKFQNKKLGY